MKVYSQQHLLNTRVEYKRLKHAVNTLSPGEMRDAYQNRLNILLERFGEEALEGGARRERGVPPPPSTAVQVAQQAYEDAKRLLEEEDGRGSDS